MARASRILKQNAVYLWIAFLAPAATTFGHALAPNQPLLKGHDAGVIVGLTLALLIVLTWLPFCSTQPWPRPVLIFLSLLVLTWLYQVVRIQLDGSVFNLTVVILPIVAIAIMLKPVPLRDLNVGLLVMSYSLIGISLASLILGFLGWMPNGFTGTDSTTNRFVLTQMLGIETRWGGPFGSVNYASPIGGLLIVIGLTRKGLHRWTILLGGVTILSLGQARTTMFAVGAAVLVMVLWSPRISSSKNPHLIRILSVVAVSVASLLYIIKLDPTLNGRTPIWLDFLGLLQARPVEGVGTTGVLEYVAIKNGSPGFVPHTHAHSVLLDGTLRFGIIFTLLTLAIFTVAVIASLRALRSGDVSQIALVVFVLVAGLTETIHSWDHWTPYIAALTWAVLSASVPQQSGIPTPEAEASHE